MCTRTHTIDTHTYSHANLGEDFISLGVLKGSVGAQNYEIPADVDLSLYSTVVIWCRQFNVPFGATDLVTRPARDEPGRNVTERKPSTASVSVWN